VAENAVAPYIGDMQYLHLPGTPNVSPGEVLGGTVTVDPAILQETGAGGQGVAHGGIVKASFEADLGEPLLAILSDMVRATPAKTVSAKTFAVGTVDHSFLYTACQPRGFRYGCRIDATPKCSVGFWAKTPSITSSGAAQPTPAGLADTWADFVVAVDTADFEAREFEVSYECNPFWHSSLDTRGAGAKRLPTGVYLGTPKIELMLRLAKRITGGPAGLVGDAIDKDIDVVITGAGIEFTFTDLLTPRLEHAVREASGVLTYQYRFACNKPYGGLTVAAPA